MTLTQQELNVRFAKALGWKIEGDFLYSPNGHHVGQKGFAFAELENVLPNYFAPENFHLVRAVVERLTKQEFAQFYTQIKSKIPYTSAEAEIWKFRQMFLSPVEHIITAYLKVKEQS